MRAKQIGLIALALCILAPPVLAQAPVAKRVTGVDAEYNALITGFNQDLQKWYEPLEKAKTDEERQKIQLDEKKNPAHTYLPKFQALARRAHGSETGAKALVEVMQLAPQIGDAKAAVAAIDDLTTNYIKSPSMERVAAMIGNMSWQLGVDKSAQMLKTIVAHAPNRTVKAAAMLSLASMYSENSGDNAAQKADARTLFVKLRDEYSDTPQAKQAVGYLFQLDHLQIGMVAPDFDATDETGKTFKLSDYRGKVVVVDFWGYW